MPWPTDTDGSPLLLLSALATHTQALLAHGHCSLLVGEPAKGDPLAHPRLSVQGVATPLPREHARYPSLRRRYLARQPKAALYADFADFSLWRVQLHRAHLNGGFGRAHVLVAADLLSPMDDVAQFDQLDQTVCAHMNQEHAQALALLARHAGRGAPIRAGSEQSEQGVPSWQMLSLDPHGFELAPSESVMEGGTWLRCEFAQPCQTPQAVRAALMSLVQEVRLS